MKLRPIAFASVVLAWSAMATAVACGSFEEQATPADAGDDSQADATVPPGIDGGASPDTARPPALCSVSNVGVGPPDAAAAMAEVKCGASSFNLRTSTQHCGECFHACKNGVGCAEGVCAAQAVVADVGAGATRLSGLVGQHLYYRQGLQAAARVLVDGGSNELLFAQAELDAGCCINASTAASDGLYLASGPAGLYRVPLDGGPAAPLLTEGYGVDSLAAPRDAVVYAFTSLGKVFRVDKDGGPFSPLFETEATPTNVLADGNVAYWINAPVAVGDPTAPMFTSSQIVRYALGSGATTRSPNLGKVTAFTFDDDFLYYYESDAGEIRRLLKSDMSAQPEVLGKWTEGAALARAMVVSKDKVYVGLSPFATAGLDPNLVIAVSKCGGTPIAVLRENVSPPLAVNGDYLYFAFDRSLKRVTP